MRNANDATSRKKDRDERRSRLEARRKGELKSFKDNIKRLKREHDAKIAAIKGKGDKSLKWSEPTAAELAEIKRYKVAKAALQHKHDIIMREIQLHLRSVDND